MKAPNCRQAGGQGRQAGSVHRQRTGELTLGLQACCTDAGYTHTQPYADEPHPSQLRKRMLLLGCHLGRQGERVSLQSLRLVEVPALQRHPLDAVSRQVSLLVVGKQNNKWGQAGQSVRKRGGCCCLDGGSASGRVTLCNPTAPPWSAAPGQGWPAHLP